MLSSQRILRFRCPGVVALIVSLSPNNYHLSAKCVHNITFSYVVNECLSAFGSTYSLIFLSFQEHATVVSNAFIRSCQYFSWSNFRNRGMPLAKLGSLQFAQISRWCSHEQYFVNSLQQFVIRKSVAYFAVSRNRLDFRVGWELL